MPKLNHPYPINTLVYVNLYDGTRTIAAISKVEEYGIDGYSTPSDFFYTLDIPPIFEPRINRRLRFSWGERIKLVNP